MDKENIKLEDRIVLWMIPAAFIILFSIYLVPSLSIKKYQPFLEAYVQQYTLLGDETVLFGTLPQPVQAIVVTSEEPGNQAGEKAQHYTLSSLTYRLPASIRAKSVTDINVIVVLVEYDAVVGNYSDGQPAYRKQMEVRLVDARNNAIISSNEFIGGAPPSSKSHGSPGYGSSPRGKAMKWIRSVLAPK